MCHVANLMGSYRKLNQMTLRFIPNAHMDDILQNAKGTAFMSTADLQSRFYQVPLAEEDKGKSCFVTPFGNVTIYQCPSKS